MVHKEKTLGVGVEQIQVPDSARVGGQDLQEDKNIVSLLVLIK